MAYLDANPPRIQQFRCPRRQRPSGTITAQYKVDATLGGSPSATFGDRTLTVIAF